jgi:hypothetical protein
MRKSVLILMVLWVWSEINAGDFGVYLGPPATGGGGTNPVHFPPTSLIDYQCTYITKDQREFSLSLVPGLLVGKRFQASSKGGGYVSLGGGLVISRNGVGPGVYTGFGWEWCGNMCGVLEYKKTLGVTSDMRVISPYALRAGVKFSF